MKKIISTSVLIFFWALVSSAQSSLSLNYLYIGNKGKYGTGISKDLTHHGVGVQGKINLTNRFYLMPDLGYFFSDYEKVTHSDAGSYTENKVQYYAANVNLAYPVPIVKSFSVFPFAGIGYFQENAKMYFHIKGTDPQYPTPGIPPSYVTQNENAGSIVCNAGFIMELYLSKNIFVTAGLKYVFDIYDTEYNAFPYINTGIGYSF